MPKPGSDEWLAQVTEDIIEPDLPIVDPHHHLWNRDWQIYEIEDLLKDTGSGHNVIKTLYMECGSSYHETGPEHLKPVGETEYVISQLKKGQEIGGAEIAGIIGKADLRLGDDVEEVLKRHIEAAEGRFRGIRHAGAWVEDRSMYSRYAGQKDYTIRRIFAPVSDYWARWALPTIPTITTIRMMIFADCRSLHLIHR